MADHSAELKTMGEKLKVMGDELKVMGDRLIVISQDTTTPPIEPPIEPPVEPPTPGGDYAIVVPAAKLTMVNGQSMVLDGDHIGVWGQPGEAVTFKVKTDKAMTLEFALDYALAAESQQTGSTRKVSVGTANKQLTLAITEDLWSEFNREWTSRVSFALPKGESVIKVEHDGTAGWSNWADLYAVGCTSKDGTFLVVGVDTEPGIPPEPGPGPGPDPVPGTGDLEAVLKGLFPSSGPTQNITWGQNINGANVPAGTTLQLPTADVQGGEWIIRGLRGTADKWITIRPATPLGFKVRNLQVWRGLGIYDGQYVRVDGIDGYGMGGTNPDGSGDFTSMIECVGGHHVVASRNRANNTGGHCVSGSWDNQGMNAPSNMYILYNRALDTSKRNPFNGSAFNLFHGTSKRTGAAPLAGQGYTDYIIGNVAFGCRSEVGGGPWGITDGNCFILDVGRDSGYDGNCLVAFNIGADNGGRGVHTLQTDGLIALFNTMVGNQTNVTEPASGEFSPHTDNGQRCQTRGNIAAATVRNPKVWYQDWQGGNGNHVVAENVVLSGTADGRNNVPLRPEGLAYLKGNSTKSRNIEDYRPVKGKGVGLVDADLRSRFNAIAAVFPDALGNWRKQAICGALDEVS
jgi:hypothetical protein